MNNRITLIVAACATFIGTAKAASVEASVVEARPGYNSWPMIQSVGGRLVCTYSRGTKHDVEEGVRGAWAKWSEDGGKTWSDPVAFADARNYGETPIGKGLDASGAALFWVRAYGGQKPHHSLYRTTDGVTFELLTTPELSPCPVQITDIIHVPGRGLVALWFAGNYLDTDAHKSWGEVVSADGGRTWVQRTIAKDLPKDRWPTEPSVVRLTDGRLLGIARSERYVADKALQWQIESIDGGLTWTCRETNIRDVMASTPSLILDAKTGLIHNYYYERGKCVLKRRVARPDDVFGHPLAWPEPEVVARGSDSPWDAGNANATAADGKHYVAYYTGSAPDTSVVVAPVSPAPGLPMKIVQIDLARQMETLSNLSNYVGRVKSLGYDTLQLYVEGRIGTKSFSLPKGECYPAADMAQLVKHATDNGLDVVPCVGLLGHADLFFKYPGNEEMDETREGNPRLGRGHDTFCISTPKTREFLRRYVAEVAAIFPGKNFNAGLDEAWNAGVCALCAPKEHRDELFLQTVLFAHEIISAAGKRMWMWDDFFDFHPTALAKTPRDIVMCHWNYSQQVSSRGSRGHFAGRLREDLLAKYAEMGFDAIPACWFRSGNAEALFKYAKRYPTIGFMVTQWEEMQQVFPGGSLPRVAAAGLMLNDSGKYPARDPYPDAVRKILPSLSDAEVHAATTVYHYDGRCLNGSAAYNGSGFAQNGGPAELELAMTVLKSSPVKPAEGDVAPDMFSEKGVLDDLVCRAETFFIADRLARLSPEFTDPRRTAADIRSAKAELKPLVPALERLVARRRRQSDLWRPGCSPRSVASGAEDALKYVKDLLAKPEQPAPADEKRLEVDLVLPDYHGIPKWKALGKFGGEWREIASGVWKPGPNDWAVFTMSFTFRAESLPTELKFEHSGYGRAQIAYAAVEDRASRIVPEKVLAVSGDVRGAENLLVDDLECAEFGTPGFLEKFFDADKATKVSSVTLSLR